MKRLFNQTYKDKRVFITGHTGFIGSWMALWLSQLKAKVLGYSVDIPTTPSLFEILCLQDKISHICGDIGDYSKLKRTLNEFQPEIIFHLAAQPLVRYSYVNPRKTYETNVMGTVNLLEAVRQTPSVKAVVNITSDKCYENKEWVFGYRECDPIGGYDPYSSSKGCSELVTAAYRKSYFNLKDYGQTHNIALASARIGNVIAGGDWADDRLIADIFKAISQDKPVVIRNPHSLRPWQHVLDPISGCLWLAVLLYEGRVEHASAYNFGPTDLSMLTVEEVTKLIFEKYGRGRYIPRRANDFHEAKFLKLDASKANSLLKWKSVYSVYEAIGKTTDWYRWYYENAIEGIYDFTLGQLNDYIYQAEKLTLPWIL